MLDIKGIRIPGNWWFVFFLALMSLAIGEFDALAKETSVRGPAFQNVPIYEDLGNHHHPISSKVPEAQRYFDQGFRLLYAFNHAEAIQSFEEAARLDSKCAICYWGSALAYGPNINAAMDEQGEAAAYAAIKKAKQQVKNASEVERNYIDALANRYANTYSPERENLDKAYAQSMEQLAKRSPDDFDAAVLYAAALMNLSPWDYWTDDGQPKENTASILDQLEGVIERAPTHPGACHYYIHAVEAAHPERAVRCAERLAKLMPGAGHLVHMPAHIYIRVGRYIDAIEVNKHAVHADENYIRDRQPQGIYPLAYYPHNYHFLAFAASMAGHREQTLTAARALAEKVDQKTMREPGMGALQYFSIMPLFAQLRFGDWDGILKAPEPSADLLYPRGIWHYARGHALVARNDLRKAEAELKGLRKIASDPLVEDITIWDINSAAVILKIASVVLQGELAAKQGNGEKAISLLRHAVNFEKALTYTEPPDWPIPVRHRLGAVLAEAGRCVEAEAVYRDDLSVYPENGWSLFGLAACLKSQGKTHEAEIVEQQFQRAWRRADVSLSSSRF